MSSSEPTPTAPDGSAVPGRTPDFAAPAAYPAAPPSGPAPSPAAYPPPSAVPQPGHPAPGYASPGAYGQAAGVPAPYSPAPGFPGGYGPPERVGRGLLFSLGGIVVGVVLAVALWQVGFFASITSYLMAFSAIWLYTKGAGRTPSRGAVGVIAVIVVGVIVCLASLIAADTVSAIARDYPQAPLSLRVRAVVENVLAPDVWAMYGKEIAMSLLFAALGTFGLIRQLGRARRA